jgi:hypothetical protein
MNESTFEQESLFFVIVGRRSIKVWEYAKNEPKPHELEPLNA